MLNASVQRQEGRAVHQRHVNDQDDAQTDQPDTRKSASCADKNRLHPAQSHNYSRCPESSDLSLHAPPRVSSNEPAIPQNHNVDVTACVVPFPAELVLHVCCSISLVTGQLGLRPQQDWPCRKTRQGVAAV